MNLIKTPVSQDWYSKKCNIITRNWLHPYTNLKKILKSIMFTYELYSALLLISKYYISSVVYSLLHSLYCSPRSGINYKCALLRRQYIVCLYFTPSLSFIVTLLAYKLLVFFQTWRPLPLTKTFPFYSRLDITLVTHRRSINFMSLHCSIFFGIDYQFLRSSIRRKWKRILGLVSNTTLFNFCKKFLFFLFIKIDFW